MTEQRLLAILEGMVGDDVKKFQWHLTHSTWEGFEPIPRGLMEGARRRDDTVDAMVDRYHEEGAVTITIEILKEMGHHNAADKLKKGTRVTRGGQAAVGGGDAGSSSALRPPAPHSISAQSGAKVAAHQMTGNTFNGPVNFTS